MQIFCFRRFFTRTSLSENALGVLTRATFPVRTRESTFQNVAVAADFIQNSHPHAKISPRLYIKYVENIQTVLKLSGAEALIVVEPKEMTRTKPSV